MATGNLRSLAKSIEELQGTDHKMPFLFIGHGSPMNAVLDNQFTRDLRTMGNKLERPKAILCISAHWLTRGKTVVDVSPKPKMIYDMGGFPKELYEIQYAAPGSPEYAVVTRELIAGNTNINVEDGVWGFDHGNWSVMKWLFPNADIPVFQLSIDYNKPLNWHYDLAKELTALREKGVLIIGSGNVTHNLGNFLMDPDAEPVDWALEYDLITKKAIESLDHEKLINSQNLGSVARIAHPEPSHWIPMMYALGLQKKDDDVYHFHESIQHGTFSMRSIKFG